MRQQVRRLLNRRMDLRRRGPHLQKTVSAVDWPTLRRSEGHRRLNRAHSAPYRHFHSLAGHRLRIADTGRDAFVLFSLTPFASLGLVLQALIRKENLLAGAKDKLFPAVNTPEYLILEFVHRGPPSRYKIRGTGAIIAGFAPVSSGLQTNLIIDLGHGLW